MNKISEYDNIARAKWLIYGLLIFLAVTALIVLIQYFRLSEIALTNEIKDLVVISQIIGGIFGPLLAGAAALLFWHSLKLQGEQLEAQKFSDMYSALQPVIEQKHQEMREWIEECTIRIEIIFLEKGIKKIKKLSLSEIMHYRYHAVDYRLSFQQTFAKAIRAHGNETQYSALVSDLISLKHQIQLLSELRKVASVRTTYQHYVLELERVVKFLTEGVTTEFIEEVSLKECIAMMPDADSMGDGDSELYSVLIELEELKSLYEERLADLVSFNVADIPRVGRP